MRESRTYGFVRGARGNSRPYRVRCVLLRCMSQLVAPCDAGQNLEFASAFGGTARAGHDGGEALRPLMEGGELPAGLAVDDGIGLFHRILTCRGPCSASP